MIQAIKELGEFKLKEEGRDTSNLLSILVQDPNQDGKYPKVLVAVFKKVNNRFKYSHTSIEDTSKSKIEKYLYRRGASNGPDYTPTAKITEVEKFFENKVKGWFKNYSGYDDPDAFILDDLKVAVEESEQEIIKDLSNKLNEIKPSLQRTEGCLFTIAIEEKNELKYLGDFPIFRRLLVELAMNDYRKILKTDHVCGVCGVKKTEVYGEAIPIPFYTLDKPGYIAGGFKKKFAWKNAPVCLECSLKIEEGKKFLDTYLKQKMGGQQYYLIPKFILGVEEIDAVIETFFYYSTHKDEVLKERNLAKITEDEKEILEALGELNDVLNYNFLFFSAPNRQVFKINLLVEDILPSRLNTIFEVKKEVEKYEIFQNIPVNKSKGKYENVNFRFDEFRQFAPSQKDFLEIVYKTFRGVGIKSTILFSWFMRKISQEFIHDRPLKLLVLKAFISFLFFKRLGIISQTNYLTKKGGGFMNELKEKAESFFNNFPDTFSTPAHKAIFLLGVLTQKLLNIQFQERGATPFRKHLKSLKMSEKDFKALLPKIQNKLEEYGKNYYHSLESLISEYFLEAGNNWKISTDELNFYFVLGMNLTDQIDNILNSTKQNGD
jgi:CRISPR-associated protein Csh1